MLLNVDNLEEFGWWVLENFIMTNSYDKTAIINISRSWGKRFNFLDCLSDLCHHYFSSHHSFSFLTCSSSAGVKSFLMLKVFLISSGVFPLIMLATVLQVTSRRPWNNHQWTKCLWWINLGLNLHRVLILDIWHYRDTRVRLDYVTILNRILKLDF